MKPISLRLPDHVVRAYDAADGNRSKVMRRALAGAVEDGEVQGVPEDLRTLAAVESIIDDGQLKKRRGTFRKRVAEFFEEKWSSGYVPPGDADGMAESWRREATLYGAEHVAWVEAILTWYRDRWDPADDRRPEWPDAGTFYDAADPGSVAIDDRLVDTLRDAREAGLTRDEAVARVSKFHPDGTVETAAARAWSAAPPADGGDA
jgi:hypothetical protein